MKPKKRRDAGRARGSSVVDVVLQQTLIELAERGVEGLSIDRIAQRAAVNKTSVYRRWPTRGQLVAAALDSIRAEAGAAVPDTGSLKQDLLALLTPVGALFSSSAARALMQAALSSSSAGAIKKLSGSGLAAESAAGVRAILKRAEKRGEWNPSVNPQQFTTMLVGAVMHRTMVEHQPIKPAWLAALVDLSLEGARPRRRVTGA